MKLFGQIVRTAVNVVILLPAAVVMDLKDTVTGEPGFDRVLKMCQAIKDEAEEQ